MMHEAIQFNLDRNLVFLHEKTAGLSHTESLLQPPYPGLNCLNWQVGHIAAFRDRLLALLDAETTLDPALASRYAPGSAPVLGEEPGIGQLDDLVAAIELAHERIGAALPRMTSVRAEEIVTQGQFTMTTVAWAFFYARHEAYHVGQLHFPYAQALAARDST